MGEGVAVFTALQQAIFLAIDARHSIDKMLGPKLWKESNRPMARESNRERRERTEKFQSFNRPKLKIAKTTEAGTTYIDYKDTESLKKLMSGNGKISSRKRTGADAMQQRMIARAIKRARYMALLPYVATAQ